MKTKNLQQADYKGKVILVVDDIKLNYVLVKAILKNTGAEILWAENGYKAIDLVDSKQHLDLILMDYNMPGINGSETARIIRKMNDQLPIISQTAQKSGEQFLNIVRDYDDIIFKPLTPEKLITKIDLHMPH